VHPLKLRTLVRNQEDLADHRENAADVAAAWTRFPWRCSTESFHRQRLEQAVHMHQAPEAEPQNHYHPQNLQGEGEQTVLV
jgi:hypothetical protein